MEAHGEAVIHLYANANGVAIVPALKIVDAERVVAKYNGVAAARTVALDALHLGFFGKQVARIGASLSKKAAFLNFQHHGQGKVMQAQVINQRFGGAYRVFIILKAFLLVKQLRLHS